MRYSLKMSLVALAALVAVAAAVACASDAEVVEKIVKVPVVEEKIVRVEVEKVIEVETEKIVEVEVEVEKVFEMETEKILIATPTPGSRHRVEKVVEVEVERVEIETKLVVATPAPASGHSVETERVSVATSQSGPEASPSYGPRDRRDRGRRYDRAGADRSGEPYDATFFRDYGVNPFVDTYRDNMSTFSVDVDTASYTVARRFISDGFLPDPDSVRVEEFVNYFDQGYTPPANQAFSIHVDGAPSPFGDPGHWLLRVGLKGMEISRSERRDATLVFVIDVSGSMNREDRLGLVKESLRVLVDELRVSDRVGIVAYGTRARVVMEPTSTRSRRAILRAIDSLSAGGSTNADAGLTLGYRMAVEHLDEDRTTRVILLSDGVANVGLTSPEGILGRISEGVSEGIDLTTVGVGMGNYNDVLMEQLADRGNGSYHYVDRLYDARRVFSESLTGTLEVIARDAKVQVEFNPEVVAAYRLIGYENREVADRDFRNDYVDAGEVGAGHDVTALYELELHDRTRGPIGTVWVRYKDPDSNRAVEVDREFFRREMADRFEDADPRFQLAAVVAEYAELLRHSYWATYGSLREVVDMAERVERQLPYNADVAEFVDLASRAYTIETGDRRYR